MRPGYIHPPTCPIGLDVLAQSFKKMQYTIYKISMLICDCDINQNIRWITM